MIRAYNPVFARATSAAAIEVETDFAIWIDWKRSRHRGFVSRRVREG
jgi:hypothetical protein